MHTAAAASSDAEAPGEAEPFAGLDWLQQQGEALGAELGGARPEGDAGSGGSGTQAVGRAGPRVHALLRVVCYSCCHSRGP